MAKEVAQSKKLEVVKLCFKGFPYDDIVKKTDVARGSMAAIVEAPSR